MNYTLYKSKPKKLPDVGPARTQKKGRVLELLAVSYDSHLCPPSLSCATAKNQAAKRPASRNTKSLSR